MQRKKKKIRLRIENFKVRTKINIQRHFQEIKYRNKYIVNHKKYT